MYRGAPVYVNEDAQRVPFSALERMAPINEEIASLFGADGPLARAYGPAYQPRYAQLELANAVHLAIKTRRHLVGEAGTGTGKSLAYAVPAILHALANGRKVVISTANLALQDQLAKKDLPFLQQALGPYLQGQHGRNFRYVVAKGKGNYFCHAKHADANIAIPYELEEEMAVLEAWADTTKTGDLTELPYNFKSERYWPLKVAVAVTDRDDCPGVRKCEYASRCWYYGMKRAAEQADVIVTNHHLLFIHYQSGGAVLPPHDVVIVDEAHAWEQVVRDQSQSTMSLNALTRLLGKVQKADKIAETEAARTAGSQFFHSVDALLRSIQKPGAQQMRVYRRHITAEHQAQALALREELQPLISLMSAIEKEGLAEELQSWCSTLRSVEEWDDKWVMWGEVPKRQERLFPLHVAPIDISSLCAGMQAHGPWIFTSATLATTTNPESQFSYFRETHGISSCSEINVGSPYDYSRQALYYVPQMSMELMERRKINGKTESSQAYNERWAQAMAPDYVAMLNACEGRTLCLFTSYEAMRQMSYRIAEARLPWPQKQQGDASPGDLVAWMKSTPGAVLFATQSFWEGIDIPGDALSCVIIDRLPFPPPDEPVLQARGELLGGSKTAFYKLSVPMATIKMKQAIGRLIRTETDRGLIAIMDVRLRHKDYGSRMLLAFPGGPGRLGNPYQLIRATDFPMVTAFINRGKRGPSNAWEQHAARALLQLSNYDVDGATEMNGVGFSKADTDIGNSLASQLRTAGRLSGKQWGIAVELAHRYRRQVGPGPDIEEAS